MAESRNLLPACPELARRSGVGAGPCCSQFGSWLHAARLRRMFHLADSWSRTLGPLQEFGPTGPRYRRTRICTRQVSMAVGPDLKGEVEVVHQTDVVSLLPSRIGLTVIGRTLAGHGAVSRSVRPSRAGHDRVMGCREHGLGRSCSTGTNRLPSQVPSIHGAPRRLANTLRRALSVSKDRFRILGNPA